MTVFLCAKTFFKKHLLSVFYVAASDPFRSFQHRPLADPDSIVWSTKTFSKKCLISNQHFTVFVLLALSSCKEVRPLISKSRFIVNSLTEPFGFEIGGGFPKWNFLFFEIYFVRLIATPINYLSI